MFYSWRPRGLSMDSPGQNTGWVAFTVSRGSSQPRDRTQVSRIAGGFFTSWATREAKINTWFFIKLKSVCPAKGTINNEKATYWMGENHISDKGLIQLNSKKKIEKWAEDLNRHISKEDLQMTNRYMKRYSPSLIIREIQIQSTVRYHLARVSMAIIQKTRNN